MTTTWSRAPFLSRTLPFALFMAFVAADEGVRTLCAWLSIPLSREALFYLYPIKTIAVAGILYRFRSHYRELRWKDLTSLKTTILSTILGVAVCVMWVHWDYRIPAANPDGFDLTLIPGPVLRVVIAIFRVAGAVAVVPVMEELFWRSFLLRYLVDPDFESVPMAHFTWFSFAVSVVFFGLEHHLVLAGMVAGAAYTILLYKTRSLAQCVLAHAVTNLALAIYVLQTGKWYFW